MQNPTCLTLLNRCFRQIDPNSVGVLFLFFCTAPGVAATNGFLLTTSSDTAFGPGGAVTSRTTRDYIYGDCGRLEQIVSLQSTVFLATNSYSTNTFTYDRHGNLAFSISSTGEETTYSNLSKNVYQETGLKDWNHDGRIDAVSTWTYTYNEPDGLIRLVIENDSNLDGIVDFRNVISFTYDRAHHQTDSLQEVDSTREGADGVVDQRISTEFILGDKGKPIAGIAYFTNSSGALTGTWSFSYNYDEFGNLIRETVVGGDGGFPIFVYAASYAHLGGVISPACRDHSRDALAGFEFLGGR